MKRKLLIIFSLLFVVALLFVQGKNMGLFEQKQAYAVGDLQVIWQTTPLFYYTNILPGFTVTKTVTVKNNGSSPRPVSIIGSLTQDSGNMKNVMHILIKQGSTVIYNNTLAQFFIDSAAPSGLLLSNLNAGATANYTFQVDFDSSAGNQYQNKKIVFDLKISLGVKMPSDCKGIDFNGKTIFGTSGDDIIQGTSKNDLVVSYEGKDNIKTEAGHDCVITSGGGDDKVDTGSGNDIIITALGNDKIDAGSGNDEIDSGDGNDNVIAGSDNDKVYVRGGNDVVDLGSGDDICYGGTGNDKIVGDSGADKIYGEEDNDTLEGGSGNDKLYGGPGVDSAKGDSGSDTCEAETRNTCEL